MYVCIYIYVYISTPVFKNIATLKTYIEYICFLFSFLCLQSVSLGWKRKGRCIFEIYFQTCNIF